MAWTRLASGTYVCHLAGHLYTILRGDKDQPWRLFVDGLFVTAHERVRDAKRQAAVAARLNAARPAPEVTLDFTDKPQA